MFYYLTYLRIILALQHSESDRKAGSNRAVQYGIVLDLLVEIESDTVTRSSDLNNMITTFTLLGGCLFHSTSVQSVRAIAASDNNNIYVVSEVSDSSQPNPEFQPEPICQFTEQQQILR